MQDIFKEQLVKKNPTVKDRLMQAALIFAVMVVFFISMTFIPGFGIVITLIAGFAAYILIGRLKKEYEYIFTNGELDIDVIYNKSSRKRVFSGFVKDFELMAHIDDESHKRSFGTASQTLDYSSSTPSERSYIFLTQKNNIKTAVIIEPNDEMLGAISKVLTRRKFHPKK